MEAQEKAPPQLSPDQAEAIAAIREWWAGDRQTFALAGYAGTGKTTVVSRLLETWEGKVVVGAPTGKAALRLREKGVMAQTIHGIAYRHRGNDPDGEPLFDYLDPELGRALFVIDEASMVNSEIYADLVSSGFRMLFVGDHGQLPPVGGDPGLMRHPDFALREIHRQDDEGLLDFAHALREGRPLPVARGAVRALRMPFPGRPLGEDISEALRDADVVIAWRNATRHYLNHLIMQLRGLLPAAWIFDPTSARDCLRALHEVRAAFPVVCLRNHHFRGIYNGQRFDARIAHLERGKIHLALAEEDGTPRGDLDATDAGFMSDRKVLAEVPPMVPIFDFGACLTAHKSQGSEWPHVAVYDETFSTMEDRARWQYTAATRAQEKLTWMHR